MDIYGTAGDDLLERLAPPGIHIDVRLWGGAGNDTIRVNRSTAIGEAGNDTIVSLDDPAVTGGGIASAAYWNSPAGIVADLAAGTVQDGFGTVDTLQGIRSVMDSGHGDLITGSTRDEQFWLSAGNDTVIGGGGNDTVFLNMRSSEATTSFHLATGTVTITKHTVAGDNGTVTLSGISSIQFYNDFSTASLSGTSVAGDIVFAGGKGSDVVFSGAGNDMINGGDSIDTVAYAGNRAGYTVTRGETGLLVAGAEGSDTLTNVERLMFADRSIAFDLDGAAGRAYRMYQAVFDRDPDLGGMGFWLKMLDNGVSLTAVAQGFVDSAEFDALYGASATSTQIVTRLYTHVFNSAADTAGIAFWAGELDAGRMTLGSLVQGLAESQGNTVDLVGVTQNGVDFVPYG
ncbi:DUF4214 domain-containing protein [Pseudoduganella sp. GCM10020061]|uniref:DUF4214 domain-containing protein n=1 Tax=Pseudoduganella sp. GCM10020061 TaxID=3317345 RepID=UPI00363E194D